MCISESPCCAADWHDIVNQLYFYFKRHKGTDRTSLVAQTVKRLPTMWETRVQSLGWENLLEKERQPTPVFLPEKSHGWKSLVGYSPWVSQRIRHN